ncbi:MAG: hypothetical protein E7258_09640 [Lachnospiraceae bacterium]|nr:hypothetical protein [Lachnospiraceae bacterium]
MNSLYKRFVTMVMISISALLGWVYCVLELRSTPVYIATISLVVVGSIYALLFSAYGIKVAKDKQMEEFIAQTVNKLIADLNQKDNEELERIAKATYVQLRKSNATLSKINEAELLSQTQNAELYDKLSESSKELVAESINKALKLAIKYNQVNNDKLIESIQDMSAEMTRAYKELATSITKLNLELIDLKSDVSRIHVDDQSPSRGSLDMFDTAEDTDVTVSTATSDSFFEEFGNEENHIDLETLADAPTYEETVDITEDIPVVAEIAEPQPAATPDESIIPDNGGLLDQNIIDALLNSINSPTVDSVTKEETPTPSTADIIPFPTAETPVDETPAEPEVAADFDPNRPLSPEEIAALFSSMNVGDAAPAEPKPEPEPEPKPEPEPVNDDPNRQLSPDEIAALFASMQ